MMQIPESTFATVLTTLAFVGVMLGGVGSMLFRDFMRKGKARIFFHDPDTGEFRETWQKLQANEFTVGKGNTAKRFILEGAARLGLSNPTWIIHPTFGWNYRGETKQETADTDPLMMRLAVSNPGSYHLAIARNRPRDALNANVKDDKWGWVPMAVMGAVVCLLMILGTVAFIAVKVANAGAAKAVGGP